MLCTENRLKMSFVILNPTEMAKNGQNHGNFSYVPPRDFKGCLLVHWLFSNFTIWNLITPYKFFNGIHILSRKTEGSGLIHKKTGDMSSWTEMCSSICPNQRLFVQKWKPVKSGNLMIFLGFKHHIPTRGLKVLIFD